jgi:hypothetical protein
MARVAVLLIAVTAAGCAQLFGIDETTGGDAAAATPFMSLQLDRISIRRRICRVRPRRT